MNKLKNHFVKICREIAKQNLKEFNRLKTLSKRSSLSTMYLNIYIVMISYCNSFFLVSLPCPENFWDVPKFFVLLPQLYAYSNAKKLFDL